MILEVVLISIFGDDYEKVASHFSILSSESARDMPFAQAFRPLGNLIIQLVAERRKAYRVCTDILGMLMGARTGKRTSYARSPISQRNHDPHCRGT